MDEVIVENILVLFDERKFAQLRDEIEKMNPADVAQIFEEIPKRELPLLFRILPKELAADTFVEMEPDLQLELIKSFSDRELSEVMDEMFVDDTVDMIEEMPANVVSRILRNTDADTRIAINDILKYPKDSAGSIMTIEYVALKRKMTILEALSRIRKIGVNSETIYTCYVTENRKLVGLVSVKDLLTSDENSVIEDIMETHIIFVDTHEDKEEVAKQFQKYDLLAMPVVDTEQRLVGIVTVDDVMDVIVDESTEDIEKMAAITPTDKPYLKTGVFETWSKRIPWLLLLMISATFTGMIITKFEAKLAILPILTSFIPMIMDTGGNSGSQASVTVIRGLALEEIEIRDILSVLWKEIRVAVLCGITLAACNFLKILLIDNMLLGSGITILTAFVVCITLVGTVFVAKVVGACMPIVAKCLNFDPAVMASPFITTIVDALSLLIYFRIATALLSL